jgi:hypothetical protein
MIFSFINKENLTATLAPVIVECSYIIDANNHNTIFLKAKHPIPGYSGNLSGYEKPISLQHVNQTKIYLTENL